MTGPSAKAPFRWVWAPSDTDQDRIRILDSWPILNITSFACEPLARWTDGRSRIVTLNHSVKEDFLKLWDRWEREGLLELLKEYLSGRGHKPVWGGGWVARYRRGAPHDQNPKHLSNHSAGTAFDLNPQEYPLGADCAADDPMRDLARVALEAGWKWGGDYKGRKDCMHLEHKNSPF